MHIYGDFFHIIYIPIFHVVQLLQAIYFAIMDNSWSAQTVHMHYLLKVSRAWDIPCLPLAFACLFCLSACKLHWGNVLFKQGTDSPVVWRLTSAQCNKLTTFCCSFIQTDMYSIDSVTGFLIGRRVRSVHVWCTDIVGVCLPAWLCPSYDRDHTSYLYW